MNRTACERQNNFLTSYGDSRETPGGLSFFHPGLYLPTLKLLAAARGKLPVSNGLRMGCPGTPRDNHHYNK